MSAIFAAASRLAMHDEKGNAFDGLYAPTAIVVLMLSIWEVLVRALHVNSVILPPPSEIMETLIERRGLLIDHLSSSLILIGSGLILSVVGGVSVAIAFTFSRRLREGVYPLLIISQVVPKVAIAPLFIVWFGTGTLPCLLLGFLIAFFPMTINSVLGFQSVDEESYRMARAFMGSKWQIFWKVQFPNALPYMFSGMKISLTLVIIGDVVSEFVASQEGIGYLIKLAGGLLDTPLMMAAITALSLSGLILYWIISKIERRFVYWQVDPDSIVGVGN
jgi:NitT/TauT family transport system permease protein